MTTTLATPVPGAAPVRGWLSFAGVLRSEWIKLLSLRSMRWTLGTMLVLSWAGTAMLATSTSSFGPMPADAMPSTLVQAAGFGTTFTVLVMGVFGVLAITSEYASGMILSTLTAVPARTPVFLAKGLVVALLALIVGGLSVFGGGFIAASIIGDGAMVTLFEPDVLVSMLGSTLYLMLAALLAYGVGALLRSSAGAISIVVALFFVATIVLQVLTITGWEWVPAVSEWMPANLGAEISTAAVAQPGAPPGSEGVGYWAALGGLTAWAAVAVIPAAILFKTRDAV